MAKQIEITLSPKPRGFHLITNEVVSKLEELPEIGMLHIFIKHTSAGLAINENADPSVLQDFNSSFDQLVKENEPWYTHTMEGSDDMPAHIKSVLTGSSISIPITDHRLNLGTWQGIYFCEFRDNGGSRKIVVTTTS